MPSEENAFGCFAWPEAKPSPGVLMVPDVWGLSDHTRDLARRLAGEGFAVLGVDPYRKTGRPRLTDVASAMAWIRELPDPVVLETLQEGIDALAAHPAARGRKIGVTGFCMGGQYTILAGCTCRGLSACAPFYGMIRYEAGLDPVRKPRSPLEAVADLSCPFLGLYGAEDAIIPVEDVRALEDRLGASGRPFAVHVYPGAGHAFMNDTRPEMYRPEAARDAWGKLVAFLRRELA
jgi:carboxymethylenebutenolidase